MSQAIYIFSGLGADERVFQLIDFSGFEPVFVKWVRPQKNETIEGYAKNLTSQITQSDPVLIGLSFGGLMAIEVARQIKTQKLIIISSAKTRREIPYYFRLAGALGLRKLFPANFLKHANPVTNWLFGAETFFDKQLLKQILRDTDTQFLAWAMDKMSHWRNSHYPDNLIHVHGSRDRILPIKYVKCNVTINGGGHLMILNKAEEISEILRKQIGTK